MTTISEILSGARRGAGTAARIPGAVLPAQAYELLQKAPGAKLVDVRTRAELISSAGSRQHRDQWQTYPGSQSNPAFLAQLPAGHG